jgi:predicted GNAT family acetyltransferase
MSQTESINAEIFTLTYGALVQQLVKDYEDVNEVNVKLDAMGHGIGLRLIDEFLARSGAKACRSFRDTAATIAKSGFRMFLGVDAEVRDWNDAGTECSLVLPDNPLADFVELPEECGALWYSNLLCGVVRGALEQVNMEVECTFVKDRVRGDDRNEMRLVLKKMLQDLPPPGDE